MKLFTKLFMLYQVDIKKPFESIEHCLLIGEPIQKLFVINSSGGYGKTFTQQLIAAKIRSEGGVVLCVASTGIYQLYGTH